MLDWQRLLRKNKRSDNQNQGPGIDGKRVVKSGRAKIRQAHKETPSGHYGTPPKDKAKLVIDAARNTTPTTKAHRAVAAVIKKSKSEGDAATTTNNICINQAGD